MALEKKCVSLPQRKERRKMLYSFIIPVFNRPDEVDELMESLTRQELKDFEVVVVEDGSTKTCKEVCDKYAGMLDLHYYYKENSGPGQSRNYGAERASGRWLIVLDSDVVLPEGYLANVDKELFLQGDSAAVRKERAQVSAWGGPDAAHPDFTPIQKAISYSMTSFFTTGGIRGGKAKLDKFYPRSFNMGILRDVYIELGGFSKMRFGEDIDFSYRMVEAGHRTCLLPSAWVWHKRRTDFRKFFRQVYNSGVARINLSKRHPGTLKMVHLLPAVFTVGVIGLLILSAFAVLWLLPLLLYSFIIFVDSSVRNRSLWVGLLSIPAAFTQLMGYGLGFIGAWWKRCVLGSEELSPCGKSEDERKAFENNFYG